MYRQFANQVNSMSKVNPIVSVKWLAEKIASPPKNLRVLDGSWHLPMTNRVGRQEYLAEHIPGAQYFDIDECADPEAKTLNHMLPKPEEFEKYVGKLGINNDTHVVVYDNNGNFPLFSAQRVWWTFRVFGYDKISVVEGGLPKWKKEGHPLTKEIEKVPEEKFTAKFRPELVKSFDQIVENQFKTKKFQLLDARPPGRFSGTAPEPRKDIKPGCIPGSTNMPFPSFMDTETQTFKSKEQIEKMFKDAGVDFNQPVVASCGSGVSACHIVLGAYLCGKEDVAVYDGAWTEYFQRADPDQMENVPKE